MQCHLKNFYSWNEIRRNEFCIFECVDSNTICFTIMLCITKTELKMKKKTNFLHCTHIMFVMPRHQGRNGDGYIFFLCLSLHLRIHCQLNESCWMAIHKRKSQPSRKAIPKMRLVHFHCFRSIEWVQRYGIAPDICMCVCWCSHSKLQCAERKKMETGRQKRSNPFEYFEIWNTPKI